MAPGRYLQNVLVGATAVIFAGALFAPGRDASNAALGAGSAVVSVAPDSTVAGASSNASVSANALASETKAALSAFASVVRPLSHPQALTDAFRSYFAFKATHPGDVKKPFLYFVDYGLPSTTPRGYVFDMSSLKVVDGPFTVAHGRGSATTKYGLPTRFSNAIGSAATSLGCTWRKRRTRFTDTPAVGRTARWVYASWAYRAGSTTMRSRAEWWRTERRMSHRSKPAAAKDVPPWRRRARSACCRSSPTAAWSSCLRRTRSG
jgi:hypothetical protein